MTGMLRVPRSRGALSGVLLVLLGAWGALIPFAGPNFHFAYTPDTAWTYTSGRLWLEVLPGAATVLGGLIVLMSRIRPVAMLGAWLAALSGGWFVVGGVLGVLWLNGGGTAVGTPVGGTVARAVEQIGFFSGLGVVIVFLAALALGRFSVVGVKEAKLAARDKEVSAAASAAPGTVRTPAGATGTARTPDSVTAPDSVTTPDGDKAPDTAGTQGTVSASGETSTPDPVTAPDETSTPDPVTGPDEAGTPRKVGVAR